MGRYLLLGLICGVIGSGCSGSSPGEPTGTTVVTLTLSRTDLLLVPTMSVTLTAEPRDAAGRVVTGSVTWTTSNPGVVTVTAQGGVTGIGQGDATITASIDAKSATVSVHVIPGVTVPLSAFVLVQPGTFTMGSAGDANRTPHQVTITRPFYLQKLEVNQALWRSVMTTSPSGNAGCDQCPVERVSWKDVQQFLTLLNAANPGVIYRLPTEAEWEYACRSGTTGDIPGDGVLDHMAWYALNSDPQGGTAWKSWPGGQKTANAWGFYDMLGNVWEWVSDWYGATYYTAGAAVDPQGPASGTQHVIRGGAFVNFPAFVSSAFRGFEPTDDDRFATIGFRLVRNP